MQGSNLMESYFFNKEVVVDAVYFKHQNDRLISYPKRIVVDGQSVTFQTGQQATSHSEQILFDMTDGTQQYQLAQDIQAGDWRLLKVATIGA